MYKYRSTMTTLCLSSSVDKSVFLNKIHHFINTLNKPILAQTKEYEIALLSVHFNGTFSSKPTLTHIHLEELSSSNKCIFSFIHTGESFQSEQLIYHPLQHRELNQLTIRLINEKNPVWKYIRVAPLIVKLHVRERRENMKVLRLSSQKDATMFINTPLNFTNNLPKELQDAINFNNEQWEIGLVSIIVPKYVLEKSHTWPHVLNVTTNIPLQTQEVMQQKQQLHTLHDAVIEMDFLESQASDTIIFHPRHILYHDITNIQNLSEITIELFVNFSYHKRITFTKLECAAHEVIATVTFREKD